MVGLQTNRTTAPPAPRAIPLRIGPEATDVRPARRLDGALLDALRQVVEPAALGLPLPGLAARVEHVVHLLEQLALGLGRREEDVDQCEPVEGAEDHVQLPRDVVQHGRHGVAQDAVPEPVGRGRETDGLGADFGGEDLRGVAPGGGAPGGGKGGDEEVAARDDGGGDGLVVQHDPGDVAVGDFLGLAVDGLQGAVDEEEDHHEEGADEEGAPATPFVDVDDGREGEDDVDDVLDGCGEKRGANVGGFHDIWGLR